MPHRTAGLRLGRAILLAALVCMAASACGSSSNDANTLLHQTFSGAHVINSGNLSFSLTVSPSGSNASPLRGPITFSFGGPFQSRGKGKLPESNFNLSISALGQTGSLGILSTGANGYVTFQGTSYQLPAATFQRLESSFSQLASSSGTGSSASAFSKLGINPLRWLVHPSIVGTESVGGASTTHIRAGVDVRALLDDLSTFLQKASSLGASGAGQGPTSMSNATKQQLAREVKNPSFDVWTGTSDKTVRRLSIKLTMPLSGQVSNSLGGLRAAEIGLLIQYADLNHPQTITAPTAVRPFSELAANAGPVLQALEGSLGGGLSGSGGSPGSTGTTGGGSTTGTTGGTGSVTSPSVQSYSQCIQAAANDVAKMQRCASLLNGK